MNFGAPPLDLRAVVPYLARATELRKKEPIIAYYCQSISSSLAAHWPLLDPVKSLGPPEDRHSRRCLPTSCQMAYGLPQLYRPLLRHTGRNNNQIHSEGV